MVTTTMPRRSARQWNKQLPPALPPCDGPKLGMFPHHDAPIEWIALLGFDGDQGTPQQSFVFRARIRDREYAVKVFRFWDPEDQRYWWGNQFDEGVDPQVVSYYYDPFYNECRAYGRIQEAVARKRLKRDIVVPAHGFLFLREEDRAALVERWGIQMEWAWYADDYQSRAVGGGRARAIVKDFVPGGPGVAGSQGTILRDIRALRRCGVYAMDIRQDNFRNGRLVDFGMAWTKPWPPLDRMTRFYRDEFLILDWIRFDEMTELKGAPNPKSVRALHPMNLRDRDLDTGLVRPKRGRSASKQRGC